LAWQKKFDVNTVFLFGSSLDDKTPANDIDLGVKGIAIEKVAVKIYEKDYN
jgi:predicted nucleotidyltransferase